MIAANDNNAPAYAGALGVLDLFSAAAGGWSLGMHRAGFHTIAACEVIPWRRALYSQNNPGVPVYDDVTTLTADRLILDGVGLPRIIVGSPPCQDISSANTKGKGVDGERSGLYFEAVRLIDECRPDWFALENSANLRTRGADRVIDAVEAIGYACWPFVVSAGDIGANHERKRSWLIGCSLAYADGIGRNDRRQGWWSGFDVSNANGSDWKGIVPHANDESKLRGGQHAEVGVVQTVERDAGYTAQVGWRERRARGCAVATEGLPEQACGDAAEGNATDSSVAVSTGRNSTGGRGRGAQEVEGERPVSVLQQWDDANPPSLGYEGRWPRRHGPDGDGAPSTTSSAGDITDSDEARQAAGLQESSPRSTSQPGARRGSERSYDRESVGQVGGCSSTCDTVEEPWADWNGGLAHHLRVDDGLSAWVAQSRIEVGGPRGTTAASLIVEAFGDAVCPQIPEAIGRAILRVEAALAVVHAANDNNKQDVERAA